MDTSKAQKRKPTKAEAKKQLQEVKAIEKTLSAFRIPKSIEFKDIAGNQYVGNSHVTIMASLELSLSIGFLFNSVEGEEFRKKVLIAANGNTDQSVLGYATIAVASKDDAMNEKLDQLFDSLHPGIREQAIDNLKDLKPSIPPHVANLFGPELKAALFPFMIVSYREKIRDQISMVDLTGLV